MIRRSRRLISEQNLSFITESLKSISQESAANVRCLSTTIASTTFNQFTQSLAINEETSQLSRHSDLRRGFSISALALDARHPEQARDPDQSELFVGSTFNSSDFSGDAEASGSGIGADDILAAAEDSSLALAWDEAWWQTIGLATLGARIATLPLVVKQIKNTFKLTKAKPELEKLSEWLKEQQAAGRGNDVTKEYTERMAQIWKKHDCNPFKSMLPMLGQFPIFIGFFAAIRSLAAANVPSLTVEGIPFAWYQDLTAVDPYYTLPILSSLIFWITIELNAADGMQGQDQKVLTTMKRFMRFLAVAMVPLSASFPLGMFCYWIPTNIFSLLQGSSEFLTKLDLETQGAAV